jgi:hypothetical protein
MILPLIWKVKQILSTPKAVQPSILATDKCQDYHSLAMVERGQ